MNGIKVKIDELLLRVMSYQRLIGEPYKYGLWDKKNMEDITIENKDKCIDYTQAYDRTWAYYFILPEDFTSDPREYLAQHNGRLYCPMLMRGTQKAMVFHFEQEKKPAKKEEYIQMIMPLFS